MTNSDHINTASLRARSDTPGSANRYASSASDEERRNSPAVPDVGSSDQRDRMMDSPRRSEPGSPSHGARSERERPVHGDDHDERPTSSRARRHAILRSDQIAPPRRDPYTAILEEEGDGEDSGIDDDGPEREPCWDFDTDPDSEVGEQMVEIRDRLMERARKQYWKDVKDGKRSHLGDEQKDAAIERIYVEMVKKEAIRNRNLTQQGAERARQAQQREAGEGSDQHRGAPRRQGTREEPQRTMEGSAQHRGAPRLAVIREELRRARKESAQRQDEPRSRRIREDSQRTRGASGQRRGTPRSHGIREESQRTRGESDQRRGEPRSQGTREEPQRTEEESAQHRGEPRLQDAREEPRRTGEGSHQHRDEPRPHGIREEPRKEGEESDQHRGAPRLQDAREEPRRTEIPLQGTRHSISQDKEHTSPPPSRVMSLATSVADSSEGTFATAPESIPNQMPVPSAQTPSQVHGTSTDARAQRKRLMSNQIQTDTPKRVRTRGEARPYFIARYLLEPAIDICHVDDIDQETLRKLPSLHDTSERALYTLGRGGGMLYVAPSLPKPNVDMRRAMSLSGEATRRQLEQTPVAHRLPFVHSLVKLDEERHQLYLEVANQPLLWQLKPHMIAAARRVFVDGTTMGRQEHERTISRNRKEIRRMNETYPPGVHGRSSRGTPHTDTITWAMVYAMRHHLLPEVEDGFQDGFPVLPAVVAALIIERAQCWEDGKSWPHLLWRATVSEGIRRYVERRYIHQHGTLPTWTSSFSHWAWNNVMGDGRQTSVSFKNETKESVCRRLDDTFEDARVAFKRTLRAWRTKLYNDGHVDTMPSLEECGIPCKFM